MTGPVPKVLFSLLLVSVILAPADLKITAEAGQNIILPCRSPDSRPAVVVEWSRTDLKPEYVLVFRDDQIDPEGQHPSFQNRVDLQDRQMKDGDVSLVLNNVKIEDTGTYVCRVQKQGSREKIKTIIYLDVEGQIITAEPGQNVTLPCRSDDSRPVTVVEWDRPDLEPEYVLLFRDGQIDPELQHPSFQNRVYLQDREMKDGDVSLVLNNVKIEDSGTCVCRVDQRGTNRKKRAVLKSYPLRIIRLQVSPPGDKEGQSGGHQDGSSAGQTGLVVAVLVMVVILVLMITAVIIIIVRRRLPLYLPPPHNETEKQDQPDHL